MRIIVASSLTALIAVGCGSNGQGNAGGASAAGGSDAGGLTFDDGGGPTFDDGASPVWSDAPDNQPPLDAAKPETDGGAYAVCDGGAVLAADRFATKVVTFTPGDCAGFGIPEMPGIVLGPPVGGGSSQGSLDVVSLGTGGTIVLSFEPNAIVDGPGPDFLVFENPFLIAGNAAHPSAELGEVSVSDDGVTWTTFPCTATAYPYGACAGWHPVLSAPSNCISPVDPAAAGGDPFDLHDVGVTHARYVRIVDKANESCPSDPSQKSTTNGFDLDALSIVNAEHP